MDVFATGSKTFFAQAAAPTGWTKDASTANDCLIRINSFSQSTGGTVSGTVNFSTAFFGVHTWSGTTTVSSASTGEVALTAAQIPGHGHGFPTYTPASTGGIAGYMTNRPPYPLPAVHGTPATVNYTDIAPFPSGGNPHSHTLVVSGTSSSTLTTDFSIQYVDVILCTAS